jgi:hypothetical protein
MLLPVILRDYMRLSLAKQVLSWALI